MNTPGSILSPVSHALMVEHAQEYLNLKKELDEVNSQTTALRKGVKTAEKALVAEMAANKIEELEIEGMRLTRARGLKTDAF